MFFFFYNFFQLTCSCSACKRRYITTRNLDIMITSKFWLVDTADVLCLHNTNDPKITGVSISQRMRKSGPLFTDKEGTNNDWREKDRFITTREKKPLCMSRIKQGKQPTFSEAFHSSYYVEVIDIGIFPFYNSLLICCYKFI